MGTSNVKALTGLFVLLLLSGCNNYEGDGQLIDHGPLSSLSPANRYTLDLGDIDLGEDGHYKYSLSNLPEGSYVFGLIVSSDYVIREPLPIKAKLKFVVKDSENKIIIDEHALVRNWNWSISKESTQSFVYRGEGTGTYLKVLPDKSYTIDIVVSNADGSGDDYRTIVIGQMGDRK